MEDKIFELLTKMYAEMTEIKKDMKEQFEVVNKKLDDKADKSDIVKVEIMIENDLTPKVQALFDGYKQNSDKLERIEKEVTKQEEIIIKRVK